MSSELGINGLYAISFEFLFFERDEKMNLKLEILTNKELEKFKKDIQEAFQKGFEDVYGPTEGILLPEKDIIQSLNTPGAIAYKAIVDNEMVGGAVVVIKDETQHNDLHLLYVKYGIQTRGIGKMIWDEIERLHPETIVWETCTPCFEKRNIHFYVNKCKFHIVEYIREMNEEGFIGDGGDGMFTFQKVMK